MTSSFSEPGEGMSRRFAPHIDLSTASIGTQCWGRSMPVGCHQSAVAQRRELVHIFTGDAQSIWHPAAVIDYGMKAAAEGSRGQGGRCALPDEDHRDPRVRRTFADANTLVDLNDGGIGHVRQHGSSHCSSTRLVPGTSLSTNVVTYEEQILSRELPNRSLLPELQCRGMEFGVC